MNKLFGNTFQVAQQGGGAAGTGSLRIIKTVLGSGVGPYTASVNCALGGAPLAGFPKLITISPSAPVDVNVTTGATCEVTEPNDGGAVSHSISPNNGDDQVGSVVIEEQGISAVTVTNDFNAVPPAETGTFTVTKQFFDSESGDPVDPSNTTLDLDGADHRLATGDHIYFDYAYSVDGVNETGTLEVDPYGQVSQAVELPVGTEVSFTQERFQVGGASEEYVFPAGWFITTGGEQASGITITADNTIAVQLNNPTSAVIVPQPPTDPPTTPVSGGTNGSGLAITGASNDLRAVGVSTALLLAGLVLTGMTLYRRFRERQGNAIG